MRKRGRTIRHRARGVPGLVVQALDVRYETRLRMCVEAFRAGRADFQDFADLVDTHDLLMLGNALYGTEENTVAALGELSGVALQNIRDRWQERGKYGATGDEIKALHLLAEVSLDFWNRKSEALWKAARAELVRMRTAERDKLRAGSSEGVPA